MEGVIENKRIKKSYNNINNNNNHHHNLEYFSEKWKGREEEKQKLKK